MDVDPPLDATALARAPIDALVLGDHDLDYGTDAFARFVRGAERRSGPIVISANLGLGILDVEVEHHRRAAEFIRPDGLPFGVGISQKEHRVADADGGVEQLAAGGVLPAQYFGAESLLVELDSRRRAFADQVGGDGVHAFGDCLCLCHVDLHDLG